jgi:uncharacterized repeat protein (TIGR01451 family)
MAIVLLVIVAWSLTPQRARAQGVPDTCPAELGTADIIAHDFTRSFCELCAVGTVRIVIANPFRRGDDVEFSELVITENLMGSGLTYVADSTRFLGLNLTVPPAVSAAEPTVTGVDGSILTWDLRGTPLVMEGRRGGSGTQSTLILEFEVERHPNAGEEGLVLANRTIEAAVALTPSCAPDDRYARSTGPGVLPLNEPQPQIIKTGRNVDAGQAPNSYSAPVYAHANDDVIWRIEVRNNGRAPLQDFEFSDSIVPGNFDIDYVCDNEADATAAANGSPPAACVALNGTTTQINGFDVAAAFGGGANPYIVAPPGGSGFYYLVGVVTDSCTNRTNTVFDVQWGCQEEPPPGGIPATSTGITAGDSALLSTQSVESGLNVAVALTGTNTAQPMGGKGTVTITIRNASGGTVKHQDGIRIRDLLPQEYVLDPTFAPRVQVTPAYGNAYPGMIDTLEWTNPAPDTFPLATSDPALPLANRDLEFLLTSSTVHPDFPDQYNMIRHGDVVRVTFRTVLIDPQYYDKVANLDVRTEAPGSDPPGTDPTPSFPISNRLEIWFEEFCTDTEHHLVIDDTDQARPEDLDVDIVGSELVFILTSTGDPLPLTVALTNNGGHDARDYQAYVTFGEAMVVQSAPPGCTATSNPPALPVWQIPTSHPASAAVYVCDRGMIRPGETERLDFQVVKNTAESFDDDLTFRADVIGEITLSDGTPLWFPTPTARPDGITDRANDYSLDAIWSRVVGFDLFKQQLGTCSENNPPPNDPDSEVQIGEECSHRIESGGWFGFQTPGFTYIAVQNVQVVDRIPDGQGYISSTDPLVESTPAILGVRLNPPPEPLYEQPFDWTFNTMVPDERILEKDHWFRVNATTRLLNDPIDQSAAPNQHAAISTNVLTSTFEAVFFNQVTNQEEVYDLGPNTVGFPREVHRRVDLTVTEPNLIVTQEVCNETRYGAGPACSNFVALADDGDAFDTYVYRVTVTNEPSASGVTRAPAYDVTVTTVTDPSDQLFVDPLPGDGLDNDGDVLVDSGDAAGEGLITDNTVLNGIPAQIVASHAHSDALRRIDAGESVILYYRVDPNDEVAPLQQLVNAAAASYDSLEGASGAQSAPEGANGELGGARQYVSEPGEATIQIIPVEVPPKEIVRTANSALATPPAAQPVSIGEEIEFQLRTLIPVAQLRDFVVRDELPAGLSCSDAPVVDLGAPPYAAAGFVPGGVFTPTCTSTEVVWSFGDQTVTRSPREDRRFDFAIRFIARVDNVAGNQDGLLIRNGGAATTAEVRYVDEAGNGVVLPIGEAALVVREPVIALEKTFSVDEVDAADVPRVTITATNTGTATAYNLRVLDDLSAVDLSFRGDVSGTDPPTVDVATFGPDRPAFQWDPGFGIAPGEAVSFSFAVEVGAAVEPHQVLPNTAQAQWTSLPGRDTALNPSGEIGPDGSPTGMRNGALPNAGDPLNDYEAQTTASVAVPAVGVVKTDLDPALAPEIGAHKPFELVIDLPEGVTRGLVATDQLDTGSVSYVLTRNADFDVAYEFVGIESINGQAPSEAAFDLVPSDGASGSAVWSVGTVVTQREDDLSTGALNPAIRIRYHARINNDLVTNVGSTLQNTGVAAYTNGETGGQESQNDGTAPIVAIESSLTATKSLTNVTPGKAPGDPAALGDVLQYVVSIVNGGDANAYDINVVDTLPAELALYGGFTPAAEIGGAPVAGFEGIPAGAPIGPLVWGRQNGDDDLDLPPGGSLLLTYQVVVQAPIFEPAILANSVWIDWTSLDAGSPYERTGDGCPNITPPDDYCFGPAVAVGTADPEPPPAPLLKENTQASASVGEAFRYRITVPETAYGFPIYDVRILDDLTSTADLRLVSVVKVEGSGPWNPVNTGTATDLVIEDPTVGIDIPAGERIVIELTVVLEDTIRNARGGTFTNTASYLYNRVDGDPASQQPGDPGTTDPMLIVGPDVLTLQKTGPATMTIGTPATFVLDLHNASDGPAWNLTITDELPDGASGGTCDVAPTGFSAQVFEANGTTPVSSPLVEGTDFSVAFSGEPDCLFTLTILSASGTVGANQRLIVSYETQLDADTQNGATLINVAGATEWFSFDGSDPETGGDRRVFTRTLNGGTPTLLDHEDSHTVTVTLPAYLFEKTVANLTTGADPASTATPGDRLRYRIRLENLGDVPLVGVRVSDELDRLNDPPAFQSGTLQLVTLPADADARNTSNTGGAQGTGLLDVGNLSLPGSGESLLIEFDITLAPVLPDGTSVTNQSQLLLGDTLLADSDDPGVNGPADPFEPGDEDATVVVIGSAPAFRVEKVSAYLTGDPDLLLAGETLRYTITVKNVGTADAVDVVLRDPVPVNTRYVAGSTTLNGNAVADGPSGTSPLSDGIPIHAPEDPTPGAMRADASATSSNVATIVFDVVVDADVIDGTVISNQAFVSATGQGVSDQPSDDPRTPIADDPTRDVVGNSPLLFAPKSVELRNVVGAPDIVDPGDLLHYTITVFNTGAVPATGVVVTDDVPANTSYVAGSTTLNGLSVGDPIGGGSPLAAGIPTSSANLTPPLPGPGEGTLAPGRSAVIEFDLRVDDGVPGGTIISNQAVVGSVQLPNLPTDGDGDPATGPEPTLVVVGDGQQLSITKSVSVVGGGAALAGSQLEYVVRVVNIAAVPAFGVVVTDDLDAATPGRLAYVAGSATMNGSTADVGVSGSVITADYSGTEGPLQPGESVVLRFRAVIDAGLAIGTTVTNVGVVTWNTPEQRASASVSVDLGGMPGVGLLNGTVWHDADFDRALGASERLLEGWTVELFRNDQPVQSVVTDAGGTYQMGGVAPNDQNGDRYALRFRAPGAGVGSAALGTADSSFTNGPHEITDIAVTSGGNLRGLNLPIDPNGVVYDSRGRTPIAGAALTLLGAGSRTAVASRCFADPAQQGQVTGADGYYKFDLEFSDDSCPGGGSYLIAVTPPASGYVAGDSQIIPPTSDASTAPFSVPTCPRSADDAVPFTPQHCEVQPSEFAPPAAVPPRSAGTTYHVHLFLDGTSVPGSSQIFNNHIPLDPVLDGSLAITKTTPSLYVSRGQLVPYEITVTNDLGVPLLDLNVVDRFPAGFHYVDGSARVDGLPVEPAINGRELVWTNLGVEAASRRRLVLLLAVGAGVGEGEYVNRAQATSSLTGSALSGEATATVRVVPDPTFSCTDVMGKVFDDANRNGVQDPGEPGLPGIRLLTARGLVATTDPHGRYHITCAATPHEARGSNFVLKLDDRTLPSGYRMSTRQVQVQRATQGKALRFNFAASIHRVVGLDLADGVFEPGSTQMRAQWRPRITLLVAELAKGPATLRLSYVADVEDEKLVERRLEAVQAEIADAWKAVGAYELEIEREVFWRRGAPPTRTGFRPPDGG